MPSAITHAVVGIAAGVAVSRRTLPNRFWLLAVGCALLPDADVIGFRLGIPYGHFFGHRGFFHSLSFALLLGFLLAAIFLRQEGRLAKRGWFYALVLALVTASHGILDAFTNGGLGIALLSPWDDSRYFFAATPIAVSPLSPRAFFSGRGLSILKNEFVWVWLPAMVVAVLGRFGFAGKKEVWAGRS